METSLPWLSLFYKFSQQCLLYIWYGPSGNKLPKWVTFASFMTLVSYVDIFIVYEAYSRYLVISLSRHLVISLSPKQEHENTRTQELENTGRDNESTLDEIATILPWVCLCGLIVLITLTMKIIFCSLFLFFIFNSCSPAIYKMQFYFFWLDRKLDQMRGLF